MLGAAVIAAIALLGIGVETQRLQRIEATLAEANAAVATRSAERAEAAELALHVSLYQEIARTVELTRLSGPAAANAIVRIGNAVPAEVWLDSITDEPAGFEVSGGAMSLDSVSRLLFAYGTTSAAHRAALVSIDNRDRRLKFEAHIAPAAWDAAR
jgi:Tfp pilus assembly protein PilN